MKHRALLLLAVIVIALTAAGSAFAFDCIRVSSSYQGLVQSTSNGGHWLLFDMTNAGIVQSNFSNFADHPLTSSQATGISPAYQAQRPRTGLPPYFTPRFRVPRAF